METGWESEKTQMLDYLKQSAAKMTSKGLSGMNKLIYGLFGTAWAFFILADDNIDKFISSLEILLILLYYAYGIYRSINGAKGIRNLHEQVRKGEVAVKDAPQKFNDISDWTFSVCGFQYILSILIMILFFVYVVRLI